MPYPGVPEGKTAEMERCVSDVMADPKIKKKYPKTEDRKSHAIAICHSSVVGGKKKKLEKPVVNINFYGDYWEKVLNGTTSELSTSKNGEEVKENMIKADKVKDGDECVMADGKTKGYMKDGKCSKKTDKVDEVVEEKKEEVKEEEKKEEIKEEEKKEEVKAEVKEETKEEPAKEEAGETSEEEKPVEEKVDATADLLKTVVARLDKLLAKDDKPTTETAPADEEASEEATPESKEEKPAEEEESKEDASPEGAEVKESLDKVTDSIGKVTKTIEKFEDQIGKLNERLTKIEKQPMPSAVSSTVVVSKGESMSTEDDARLKEINVELQKLENLKVNHLEKYQSENKWQNAMTLVNEKQVILSRKG